MTKEHYKTVSEFLMLKISDFKKSAVGIRSVSSEKMVQDEVKRLLQDIKNTVNAVNEVTKETNVDPHTENRVSYLEAEKDTLVAAHDELRKENSLLEGKIGEWSLRYDELLKENNELQKKLNKIREGEKI